MHGQHGERRVPQASLADRPFQRLPRVIRAIDSYGDPRHNQLLLQGHPDPVAFIPPIKFHPSGYRAPEIKSGLTGTILLPQIQQRAEARSPSGTTDPVQGLPWPGSMAAGEARAALASGRCRAPGAGRRSAMSGEGSRELVVVGVDGSAESVRALGWAARYAAATGARVQALL